MILSTELAVKILLIILTLFFITYVLVKRFIYFRPVSEFLELEEPYTEIKIRHLHGWILENGNDKIVIYCPGNNNNISYRQRKIKMLHDMNLNVLIFDYSGFGKSSGIPNEQQTYDDACLITSMVLQKYDKNNIIIFGEQIGSAVAIYVARRYNIQTIILKSPLLSINYMFNENIRKFFGKFFTEFSTDSYLNGYTGRSLILYTYDDNVDKLLLLCTDKIVFSDELNIPWQDVKRFIYNN
jgi:pimeloyl-ACP methyl ester carboxylesterase